MYTPSARIFTIDSSGDVKMELLDLGDNAQRVDETDASYAFVPSVQALSI